MPSGPPPADTKAIVSAYTWLQREAIAVAEGRTEIPVAVPRLVQLVPPARVDLVDEVLVRVALRYLTRTLDWPPHPRGAPARLPGQAGAPWRGAHAGAKTVRWWT